MIVVPDHSLPLNVVVNFVHKDTIKMKMIKQMSVALEKEAVKVVRWASTVVKLVQSLKLFAKIAPLEHMPMKMDKLRAKTIAVLDHLLLPINLLVSNVLKDNFKIKTTN